MFKVEGYFMALALHCLDLIVFFFYLMCSFYLVSLYFYLLSEFQKNSIPLSRNKKK